MLVHTAEQGYALISALWLLLLAASIAALLMSRAVTSAHAVASERRSVTEQLRLESALETAMADLVINTVNARIGSMPTRADYRVDGVLVHIAASRESDRVDINDAPMEVIDAELQQAGVAANVRQAIVNSLVIRRGQAQRLASNQAIARLFSRANSGEVGSEATPCIAARFTVHGGRRLVAPTAPPTVGGVAVASSNASAIRLTADDGLSHRITVIARQGGQSGRPMAVIELTPSTSDGCDRDSPAEQR